jgi:hypothetical protein
MLIPPGILKRDLSVVRIFSLRRSCCRFSPDARKCHCSLAMHRSSCCRRFWKFPAKLLTSFRTLNDEAPRQNHGWVIG